MVAIRGRVVITPGQSTPYKVVLEHERGTTEHPVQTVAEGEALIRKHTSCAAAEPIGGPEWHI